MTAKRAIEVLERRRQYLLDHLSKNPGDTGSSFDAAEAGALAVALGSMRALCRTFKSDHWPDEEGA